ncbi:SUKH-3 domain-containing protein [Streptomyces sp. NPDC001508]|uniref:SUKH-3 domain-containing protein n=1 Tax=Streptomyces sp. NPDC001508 TaxID=3154656 RepID=UPI0033329BB0
MSHGQVGRWSPQTDEVLRRAGWRPGRAVPTETWEAVLLERGGFVAHEAARRFLAEFGGLVTYGWPVDPVVTGSAVRFDPLPDAWEAEAFASMSREAGTALYPVGRADGGGSRLGIAEDGALHLATERVERLGGTADEALDRLIAAQGARTAPRRPDDTWAADRFRHRLDAADADETAKGDETAGERWSARTDRVLRAGGWFPGRSIPTATWETVLLETGEYEIHDAAQRFLAEFGYVGVPFPAPGETPPGPEFLLDPLAAMWDAEIIDDLAEQAGADLYPVGTMDRRNQYLAVAEDGSLYAGMDSVRLLGHTTEEALAKLTGQAGPGV